LRRLRALPLTSITRVALLFDRLGAEYHRGKISIPHAPDHGRRCGGVADPDPSSRARLPGLTVVANATRRNRGNSISDLGGACGE